MTLGYYYQNPFVYRKGLPEIPIDLYLACQEFLKYFDEVVILANHQEQSNRNTKPLPEGVKMVDIGPLKPHWVRLLGFGYDRERVRQASQKLDALIIQGPTTLVPHIGKDAPRPLKIFLQVGFWGSVYPGQFRSHSLIKEIGLQCMVRIAEYQQKQAFKKGIIFSNNPLKLEMYKKLAPGYFISKGLVRKEEISKRTSFEIIEPIKLLYYGRIESDKHIETIIRACRLLKEQEFPFHFDIVGGASGPYLKHLLELTRQLDIEKEITFHGPVPFHEKQQYFNRADIFIFHTCGTEGFPRVIWEAFSFGTPVIAANYPGADLFFEIF